MKIGDYVVHILSGDRGRIKSISDTVATITREIPIESEWGYTVKVFICQVSNLRLVSNQLSFI